jgi:hypothetical protein
VTRAIRQRGDTPIDWSQFDKSKLTWTIPSTRMKGKNGRARAHTVPLTLDVLRVLESLPLFAAGDYLFSRSFGRTPAAMSTEIKTNLDAAMLRILKAMARKRGDDPAAVKLPHWVQHDLRRTMRSGLSGLKIPEHVAEATIGHIRGGVVGTYDRHSYADEKRDALVAWGARLCGIVEPAPAASNVVSMHKAGALT